MAFPFLALSIQALGSFLSSQFGIKNPKAELGIPLGLAALSAFVLVSNNFYVANGSFSSFGLGANTDVVPAAALEDIGAEALPSELVNLIPDGGYLAANGHPNYSDHRVGFQGRDSLYNLAEALRGAPEAWSNFAASNNTEVIILNTSALLNTRPYGGSSIIPRLMVQQKYRLAYFDGATAVLAKPSAATEALLTNTELRAKGLQRIEADRKALAEKSGGSFPKGLSARVFGAATVFYNLGQHAEALKLLRVATAAAPTWNDGWLHKGMCQLALGEAEDAIDSLNTALRINKKDVRTWIVLAQAYDKNEDPSGAEQARERAMQIDAQRAAAMLGKAAEEGAPEAP